MTRRAAHLVFVTLASLLLCAPLLAHAEGGSAEDAPVKPKVIKRKAKPVAKAVTLPAGPVPYTAYTASATASPQIAKAVTPSILAPDALPQPAETTLPPQPLPPLTHVTVGPLPVQSASAPPPSPPLTLPPAQMAATPPAQTEISLKCETTTSAGKKTLASGSFYIDLFPSAVFPDQTADFQFIFVDPGYKSLIRESICLDTTCTATVSGTAYYLVNRRTKHGSALRITLDRARGAFYAEDIDAKMMGGDTHVGEQGWCTPQPLPKALF